MWAVGNERKKKKIINKNKLNTKSDFLNGEEAKFAYKIGNYYEKPAVIKMWACVCAYKRLFLF